MDEPPYIDAKDGLPARRSGIWARRKHHYLNNYCGIATKAMQGKFQLVYLDVMAGPGLCKLDDTGEEFPGSPFVALDHEFDKYIFIESDPRLAQALRERVSHHPKSKKVTVLESNWTTLAEQGHFKFDHKQLVVAFVDPTGISQVPMSAMLKLAKSPRIDMLVTIQYRLGIVWNVQSYRKCQDTETALDRFLDWEGWREWSDKDPTDFGQKAIDRFCARMQQDGFIGTRHVSVPEGNPIYRFTLFSRNQTAENFWKKILRIDEKGQRELLLPGV